MDKRRLILPALAALSCLAAPPETRFGREILPPSDPARYGYTKLDSLDVPTLRSGKYVVKCFAYQDAGTIFVEVGIQNRSGDTLTVAKDFITAEAGSRKLLRRDTVRTATEIEAAAVRPFVPTPAGRNAAGKPVYDRTAVDREAQRHLELQEREASFAGMLVALAQENSMPALEPRLERTIVCTFERPKAPAAALHIVLRIGAEEFAFDFSGAPAPGRPGAT